MIDQPSQIGDPSVPDLTDLIKMDEYMNLVIVVILSKIVCKELDFDVFFV